MKGKFPYTLQAPSYNESGAYKEKVERFRWLRAFKRLNGRGPSYGEMAEGCSISRRAAAQSIEGMESEGWLAFDIVDGKRQTSSLQFARQVPIENLSHLSYPPVSVVINTYNRPASLGRLLVCLSKQLHTDFRDLEVVIVNDGSDTPGYPTEFNNLPFEVQYHDLDRHPEGKPLLYSRKNFGIMRAKHEAIWLLDDDLYFDEHSLLLLRVHMMFLKEARPLIIPHYADNGEPIHYQNPFPFQPQPIDWDKTAAWPSFAGMAFFKRDWELVGGIDTRYDGAMGFADLDFGLMMWLEGCQVMHLDGPTCFIDDGETGSHRNRFLEDHRNGKMFIEKWPEIAPKYGITD